MGAFIPASASPVTVAWSAVIGAAISAGLLAAAVALQPQQPREGRMIGSVLLGAGIALTIAALAVIPLRAMPTLPAPALPTMGLATVIAAAARTLRARGRLITSLALGVVPYAAAALLPAAFVPALTAILACIVAGLFAGGLRTVTRSSGLRRNLPITDRALVAVHLVIPLAATLGWTLGVLPALLPLRPVAAALIPVGAVLVTYRVASQPSLDYSGPLYMDPSPARRCRSILPANSCAGPSWLPSSPLSRSCWPHDT